VIPELQEPPVLKEITGDTGATGATGAKGDTGATGGLKEIQVDTGVLQEPWC